MFIKCEVCKKKFYIRPSDYKIHKYRCCSRKCSFKNKKRKTPIGKKHPNWKGNKVKYAALHIWVKSRLLKPKLCENCHKKISYDLANKGIYNRDLKNWWYLCRKCHMELDGRLKNLLKNAYRISKSGKYFKCHICRKSFYYSPYNVKKYKSHYCSCGCKLDLVEK